MKILVTGGAGFIGSHLVDHLISLDHKLVVLDDLSSGKIENINPKAKFIKGDVNDRTTLLTVFADVDICYHLAAIASVNKSCDEWIESHDINLGGAIRVFAEAAARQIPVIYASSAAVYGDPNSFPVSESHAISAKSPYGIDKYCCELQAKAFGNIRNLHTTGLRFFNVYGKRQDPKSPYSGVISVFKDKIDLGDTVQIFGDGLQERDFIYIDDVVRALVLAQKTVSPAANVYNVCTGHGVTLKTLLDTMFHASGKMVEIEYLPPRIGDIYKSIGNPAKALQDMPFKASSNIESGLKKLYDLA